jgi:hypothetical protein
LIAILGREGRVGRGEESRVGEVRKVRTDRTDLADLGVWVEEFECFAFVTHPVVEGSGLGDFFWSDGIGVWAWLEFEFHPG